MKMIEKIFRWGLFCAGIIMAIFAGYMFYIDKIRGIFMLLHEGQKFFKLL